MTSQSNAGTLAVAAIILVVLPLLATLAALAAHLGLTMTGAGAIGMFPRVGLTQGVLLVWSALAAGIVMALIASIVGDRAHA
jgi:hypothetical protein